MSPTVDLRDQAIAVELDGAPRPTVLTSPPRDSAAAGTTGGGFSGLWEAAKRGAPAFARDFLTQAVRSGSGAVPVPAGAVAAPPPPEAPTWLPLALVGAGVALLVALVWE